MGILKVYLLLLIPLFVIANLARISFGNGITVTPLDTAMILTLPFLVYTFTSNSKKLKKHPLAKHTGVLLGAFSLSLLASAPFLPTTPSIIALGYLVRLVAYAQLIFVFHYLDKEFASKYISYLFYATTAAAFLGLFQYFSYNDLRNLVYLGWDEHLNRLFSTFFDPNFAGVIFALGAALGVFLFQTRKGNTRKTSLAFTIIHLVSLVLTYSRTAYIAAGSAFLALTLSQKKKILLLIPLLLASLVFVVSQGKGGEGVDLTRTASIYSRLEEYGEGVEIFRSNPILGVGFNAYTTQEESPSKFTNNAARGLPNSYIFTLATTGVIGLAALCYFFYGVYKFYSKEKNKFSRQLLLSLSLILLTSAFFDNTLYYNYIMFIAFSVLGVLTRLRESTAQ